MLFPEEDAPLLKAWIVKRLENTSDADADVLADYVLALLRHDGSIEDVRKLCEEEIPDFLKEDTSVFVNDVFQAIRYKSYLPGAPPPPKEQPPPAQLQFLGLATPSFPQAAPLGPAQNGSKKRSFQETGDADSQTGREMQFSGGGRSFKQPRRGGRGGRNDDATRGAGRGAPGGGYFPGGRGPASGYPPGQGGLWQFDPGNPLEGMMKMEQLGIPLPALPDMPQQQFQTQRSPQQRRRGRCRDYDIKGYCARGQNCMFEHGPSSMYIPPAQVPGAGEEYDPNSASMMMTDFNSQMPPPLPFHPNGQNNGPGRDNRQGGKRTKRAPFSADGPVHDRTKSTIVVENIPEEHFSEEEVRGFFSQFGKITDVSMQPYKRLAIVKYEKWGQANAAFRSPKVIFDNRFVKVFWYKEDGGKSLPPSTPLSGSFSNGNKNGSTPANGAGQAMSTGSAPDNEVDMEEFTRKQEEAQKQHEEKMRKKEEVERQRQELEKRQKELLAKQQEERQKLLAKLAAAAAGTKKEGGDGENDVTMKDDGTGKKPTSQTEALRAQLALLEEEAKMLGLDPNAAAADETSQWSGGYRGRGRGGSYRARGGFAPRAAFRGAFRGRGGGAAAYAAFSLDNRPRKVAVTGLDFTTAERDEALRQHLFSIGEFTDIQETPGVTQITFKDRKTAEKFYHSLTPAKEIPGVSGPVEFAWVNNTAGGPIPTASATAASDGGSTAGAGAGAPGNGTAKQAAAADVAMSGSAANGGADKTPAGTAAPQQQHQEHAEMDYDVADENDWGID
ncbi:RNA recognition motif-containing protein [Pleurostoma richardsiae]|uniref:RNA recognition motif-containing protein n=1 Tax=Pleurostoma richardsiae TaxID=41990 RepID=A0AA38VKB4_9PEZI|nr:RNA recognition motif-containing protein [Pleurostoma richardsiae]